MKRSGISVIIVLACLIGMGCSSATGIKRRPAAGDPFVGFFAHPDSGMLELKRADGEGKYRGFMWADFGPYPVELVRDSAVAVGTVTYGGANHPLRVESTARGLILTADGTRGEAPRRPFEDQKAFEKWFEAQGGYRANVVEE
jgi:hypothetical protein